MSEYNYGPLEHELAGGQSADRPLCEYHNEPICVECGYCVKDVEHLRHTRNEQPSTAQASEFDKVFAQLEASDYPATCDQCGVEGTNASMENHTCNELPAPRAGERDVNYFTNDAVFQHLATSTDCKHGHGFTYDFCPIVNYVNQHATLVEQRERLVATMRKLMIRFEQTGEAWMSDPAMSEARETLATIEQEGEA